MNAQQAKAEIIEVFTSTLNELESIYATEKNVITNQGWCVRNTGVYMNYTFDGIKVVSVKAGGIQCATRLSEINARHLAQQTKNGADKLGEAVPFVRSLIEEIKQVKEILESIKAKQV